MDKAQGYRVPFTKSHADAEKLWGLIVSSPLMAVIDAFQIASAILIPDPARKSANHPGINFLLL